MTTRSLKSEPLPNRHSAPGFARLGLSMAGRTERRQDEWKPASWSSAHILEPTP